MKMAILELKNLTKRYKNFTALDNVNLTLEAGRIVGLLGPNGSGKTTMIKLANGLLQPTEGYIAIDGKLPGVETKAIVAYLSDKEALPNWMNVKELIQFYKDFFKDFDEARATEMLQSLNISLTQKLSKMSKGTKEKVRLILTMSRRAKVYFLDEPIAGVDPAARDYILRTIISNYEPNALVLISTHLIADVENVLDEAIFLKYGHIIMHKNVQEVVEETGKSLDEYFREVFAC
ncbi:MAG: ABC transporter ATP-binding protein [Lachnospiraceae bacterium]|nr:ABC transporter ATP-binding protein [Lachnospiraceae bacterium]